MGSIERVERESSENAFNASYVFELGRTRNTDTACIVWAPYKTLLTWSKISSQYIWKTVITITQQTYC